MYTIDNEFFVGLLLRITKNIYAILQVVFSFKCQLQSRAKYINITQTPILKISELLCKLFHDQQTYRIGQKSKKKKNVYILLWLYQNTYIGISLYFKRNIKSTICQFFSFLQCSIIVYIKTSRNRMLPTRTKE